MVDFNSVISGMQEMFTSKAGADFLIWLVAVPVAFIIIVTLILMKSWEHKPQWAETLWFKILYVVVLYMVAVAVVSLFFGFVK